MHLKLECPDAFLLLDYSDKEVMNFWQNNRKRKQHSSSGPANSTGTGNTVGPSPSSPASTHTPGDVINTASMQHGNGVPKSLMMYGPEGAGSLAMSSNLLVWLLQVTNVKLFLSLPLLA